MMQRMVVRVGLGLVILVALAGCSGGDDPPRASSATTLAEGRRQAQEMIDATLARVASGRQVSDAPKASPAPCDDPSGGPSATLFTEDYGKRLSLVGDQDADTLLRSTREFWEARGYAVQTRDLASRVPVVFAEVDGFNLSLQVVRDKDIAEIGASTPCLPR